MITTYKPTLQDLWFRQQDCRRRFQRLLRGCYLVGVDSYRPGSIDDIFKSDRA